MHRVTISAVFLSISLVLKTVFTFHIPMFGQDGMRVGLSGIFSAMPALLFGPMYGAAVSALSDLLGYLLKPTGEYLPIMTLSVGLGGFIRGILWAVLSKKNTGKMRILVVILSVLLLILGIFNAVFLSADKIDNNFYDNIQPSDIDTKNMHFISRLLITRTVNTKDPSGNIKTFITFVTSGVIGSGIMGIILLTADFFLSKKFAQDSNISLVPQVLISMIISGLVVTTINTVVLREIMFVAWKALPFPVVWIPRIIEEILSNTVISYFIAVLMGVFEKQTDLKKIIGKSQGKNEKAKQ